MKIILDGNEVRDLFEAYRYYVDPDSPVDFNDIVTTINSRNKDFNELLYYACLTILNWHSCSIAKLGIKPNARRIGKELMYSVAELKHPGIELGILDIEVVPGSFDIIITITTESNVCIPAVIKEHIDPGSDVEILDEHGEPLTES